MSAATSLSWRLFRRKQGLRSLFMVGAASVLVGLAGCAETKDVYSYHRPEVARDRPDAPPPLASIAALEGEVVEEGGDEQVTMRRQALKDAALIYGTQSGLARRSWEINQRLRAYEGKMSSTFNFRPIMIDAPGGGMIAPPVIEEADGGFAVAEDRQSASMADHVYRIIEPARIFGDPLTWHEYLVRQWSEPQPPAGTLLPRDAAEKAVWQEWVTRGWDVGVQQAEDIYQYDLNRLERDFKGMLRYHDLVAKGQVDELYLAEADLGVTGDDDTMRIGERVVRITVPAKMNRDPDEWAPIIVSAR
jgi:defect-in-organelle-trafficking protein DotC